MSEYISSAIGKVFLGVNVAPLLESLGLLKRSK